MLAAVLATAPALVAPAPRVPAVAPLAQVETALLDYLDAVGAAGYLESGGASRYEGRDLPGWHALRTRREAALRASLAKVGQRTLIDDDRAALAALRRTLETYAQDATVDDQGGETCADASRRDLGHEALRSALVACFVEHGNRMRFEGREIDRGTALQLLHVVDEPARRKAIFDAFRPLWTALNGRNDGDSPYRRLIGLAVVHAKQHGSEIDAAAGALGLTVDEVERWLVQALEAWRDASPAAPVEPWDFRWLNGAANRELQSRIPAGALLPLNRRFYGELGADLAALGVVYDLEPRADKSPLAYSDFLRRGRETAAGWQRPVARVVGTYPEGGLFALNELVHENGHAVHVSAMRTRPAYMDWPDSLFTEAFADVPAWSVHEPAWQQRYLGTAVGEAASLRALLANVVLDMAWSLFELRLLRDPAADPNAVWTKITHDYLRIVPHPELPWWAMRVQLAGNPGYMVNYGLGAFLTAEIRDRTSEAIGPFDAGNPLWYPWLGDRLLLHGSAQDSRSLMQSLLGRRISPEALLQQIRRCRTAR